MARSRYDCPQALKSLQSVTHEFTHQLRRDFAQEISRDPRNFKKRVLALVRCDLPLRPGRPKNPRLDAAFQLVKQGRSIKDVLGLQIPGFVEMDAYGRYLAGKRVARSDFAQVQAG